MAIARIYYALQPPTLLESDDTADLELAGLFEKGSRRGFQRDHIRGGLAGAAKNICKVRRTMDVLDPLPPSLDDGFLKRSGPFCFRYILAKKLAGCGGLLQGQSLRYVKGQVIRAGRARHVHAVPGASIYDGRVILIVTDRQFASHWYCVCPTSDKLIVLAKRLRS